MNGATMTDDGGQHPSCVRIPSCGGSASARDARPSRPASEVAEQGSLEAVRNGQRFYAWALNPEAESDEGEDEEEEEVAANLPPGWKF